MTIANTATGVITAADSDAVRPGADAMVNNCGRIEAYDLNSGGGPKGTMGSTFRTALAEVRR